MRQIVKIIIMFAQHYPLHFSRHNSASLTIIFLSFALIACTNTNPSPYIYSILTFSHVVYIPLESTNSSDPNNLFLFQNIFPLLSSVYFCLVFHYINLFNSHPAVVSEVLFMFFGILYCDSLTAT